MGIPHMFDQMFTEKAQDMMGNSDSVLDRQAVLHGVALSAQLPGRVNMIAGKEGDFFDNNTVLLSLDDAELLAKNCPRRCPTYIGKNRKWLENFGAVAPGRCGECSRV